MKKLLYNSNLYLLLLLPIFILMVAGMFYRSYQLELPSVQTEIVGIFNNRTIFQVLCEAMISQIR